MDHYHTKHLVHGVQRVILSNDSKSGVMFSVAVFWSLDVKDFIGYLPNF